MEIVELELTDILNDVQLFKEGKLQLTQADVVLYSKRLMAETIVEMDKFNEGGNKAAGRRSRKYTLLLESLFKSFRKTSV